MGVHFSFLVAFWYLCVCEQTELYGRELRGLYGQAEWPNTGEGKMLCGMNLGHAWSGIRVMSVRRRFDVRCAEGLVSRVHALS